MNTQRSVILSTAYLPPVHYFCKLVEYPAIFIESDETYAKQSYRNRCEILSANGRLPLSIPVVRPQGNHTNIKDVGIDYSTCWQKNHWKAIESAYRTSAYWDFVADTISPFFHNRFASLLEFNNAMLNAITRFVGITPNIRFTSNFLKTYPADTDDLRDSIHPKGSFAQTDPGFKPFLYFQVFGERFGFTPNLSIIDLLFNEGLNTANILRDSIAPY